MKIEITVKNETPEEITVENKKALGGEHIVFYKEGTTTPKQTTSEIFGLGFPKEIKPDDPEFQETLRVNNLVKEFSRKHDMPFVLCADVLNKYMHVVFTSVPLDQECINFFEGIFEDIFGSRRGYITKSNFIKLDFLLGRGMEKYERGESLLSTYIELISDVTITNFDNLLDVYLRGATAREDSRNYLIGYRLPKIIDYDKLKEETEKVGYYKTKYGIMYFTGEV